MKRICLVSFGNINGLPYVKTYIDKFVNNGIKCDIVFWDREGNEKTNNSEMCTYFPYSKKATADMSRSHRYGLYFGATFFIRKILSENQYDGIVFLQTHAAVACFDILKKKYSGKYIVDVRDYTLENFTVYFQLEKIVMKNAFATVISSPAYKQFLPAGNFVVAHNYMPIDKEIIKKILSRERNNKPINISFVGTVRFFDMDKKVLGCFANDERFHLNYIGVGSELLKDYCKRKGINNASFVGGFTQRETFEFYLHADIINNLYGNNSMYLDYALSNKLYHAVQLQMPILVSPRTYMEELINKTKIGFVFDVNDNDAVNKLFKFYTEYDWKSMQDNCNSFLDSVLIDMRIFDEKLMAFCEADCKINN